MSYQRTQQIFSALNSDLRSRYEVGDPVALNIAARPQLRILSFDPLAYRQYGIIRNRAPQIAGKLTLRQFLFAPHPAGEATIVAGVEAGGEGYGFIMDGHNEGHRQAITDVARILGHSGFRLT